MAAGADAARLGKPSQDTVLGSLTSPQTFGAVSDVKGCCPNGATCIVLVQRPSPLWTKYLFPPAVVFESQTLLVPHLSLS